MNLSLSTSVMTPLRYAASVLLLSAAFLPQIVSGQDTGLEGAVSLWRFDDGSGTWAMNEVDFMYDGTLVGDPAWGEGVFGSALQFDGEDDAMEVSSNPLEGAHSLTVQAYIKPAAIPDHSSEPSAKIFNIALERATEGYDRFMFEIVPRGSGWGLTHFMAIAGNRSEPDVGTLVSHPFDEWYHIALVFDSLSAEEVQIKQYVDRTLELEATFTFSTLTDGALYVGKRYQVNSVGSFCYFQGSLDNVVLHSEVLTPDEFMPLPGGVSIVEFNGHSLPRLFLLEQNYPNPFNPGTSIRYVLYRSSVPVRLDIFDLSGRGVSTLVNEIQNAGTHTVEWDGRADAGIALPSGIYWYRLEADGQAVQKKMILLR